METHCNVSTVAWVSVQHSLSPSFSPLSISGMLSPWVEDKLPSEWRHPKLRLGPLCHRPSINFDGNQASCKIQNLDFKRQENCRRTAMIMKYGFLLNGLDISFLDKLVSCRIPCHRNAQNSSGSKESKHSGPTLSARLDTNDLYELFFNPLLLRASVSSTVKQRGHLTSRKFPQALWVPGFVIARRV